MLRRAVENTGQSRHNSDIAEAKRLGHEGTHALPNNSSRRNRIIITTWHGADLKSDDLFRVRVRQTVGSLESYGANVPEVCHAAGISTARVCTTKQQII